MYGNKCGEGLVYTGRGGVSHAIEYCTNPLRGLSATAEFLVNFHKTTFNSPSYCDSNLIYN